MISFISHHYLLYKYYNDDTVDWFSVLIHLVIAFFIQAIFKESSSLRITEADQDKE